jgi:hypothetical protein
MTGQLITTSFEQQWLETGTLGFMTDTPYKTMKVTMMTTWITDLWKFMDQFRIHLRDDIVQLQLPLQRKHDKFVMD